MPVSSPSYFPPNRANGTVVGITAGVSTTGSRNFLAGKAAGQHTAQSDLIVIGDSALSAGTAAVPLTDTAANGSIAVGSNAAAAFMNTAFQAGTTPSTVIGFNAAKSLPFGYSNTVIGDNALATDTALNSGNPTFGMVVIGSSAMEFTSQPSNGFPTFESIVIGHNALPGAAASFTASQNSVVIGANALTNFKGGGIPNFSLLLESVIIGAKACQAAAGGNSWGPVTIIGYQAGASLNDTTSSNNGITIIGEAADCNDSNATFSTVIGGSAKGSSHRCVVLGYQAAVTGTNHTDAVAIGANVTVSNGRAVVIGSGAQCNAFDGVFIGYNAGVTAATNVDNQLLIETNGFACIYGNFASGNLVLGTSVQGTNRDFGGTTSANIVKILNGAVGNANPVGGGYFYVSAGALHWVGSSGTDTTLAPA